MMIQNRDQTLSIQALCELLDVSESGYYAWCNRDGSMHQQEDVALGEQIERIFRTSRNTYGSDRIHKALRKQHVHTSRKRVARLMRERGLRSVRVKNRRFSLTKSGQNAFIVPNLLEQDFSTTTINQKWVTDTTYIPTRAGWLYLVRVVDLYSRQVVGWAMGDHHDAQLATLALQMALQHQRPPAGLILHSDRGSEFANARFHQQANDARIHLSMSAKGNCFDNAVAESFFATLKLEAVQGQVYATKQAARQHLFDFIEVFYNRQRLHSGIDYRCPIECAA